jgi:hypothetical protein
VSEAEIPSAHKGKTGHKSAIAVYSSILASITRTIGEKEKRIDPIQVGAIGFINGVRLCYIRLSIQFCIPNGFPLQDGNRVVPIVCEINYFFYYMLARNLIS